MGCYVSCLELDTENSCVKLFWVLLAMKKPKTPQKYRHDQNYHLKFYFYLTIRGSLISVHIENKACQMVHPNAPIGTSKLLCKLGHERKKETNFL